jgi:hypothetical protein
VRINEIIYEREFSVLNWAGGIGKKLRQPELDIGDWHSAFIPVFSTHPYCRYICGKRSGCKVNCTHVTHSYEIWHARVCPPSAGNKVLEIFQTQHSALRGSPKGDSGSAFLSSGLQLIQYVLNSVFTAPTLTLPHPSLFHDYLIFYTKYIF